MLNPSFHLEIGISERLPVDDFRGAVFCTFGPIAFLLPSYMLLTLLLVRCFRRDQASMSSHSSGPAFERFFLSPSLLLVFYALVWFCAGA